MQVSHAHARQLGDGNTWLLIHTRHRFKAHRTRHRVQARAATASAWRIEQALDLYCGVGLFAGALVDAPGAVIAGVALGAEALYEAVPRHVRFREVGHTHDHGVLAAIPRLTAINSALCLLTLPLILNLSLEHFLGARQYVPPPTRKIVEAAVVILPPLIRGMIVRSKAPVFAGREADTTEENLQSRSRGVIMMALSNKLGGLLLTTGNKSEYAVGYATIYGDMCGGYAPIKDLYKTEVFALARWRTTVGGAPVIPPAVIERPPSAELRENQKDQDSLPPYDVLDAILLRHVDQEQSREEIVAAGFDAATVDKVLKLVRIGEWKRHQAAPGPKVSRRAFGRERRYPITNGYRD